MKKEYMTIELKDNRFVITTDKKSIPVDVAEEIVNTVSEGLSSMWRTERKNYKTIIFMQTIAVLVLFISVITMYFK